MNILQSVIAWLSDPVNWQGPDGIPTRLAEHVQYSLLALAVAALIALPLGLVLGHRGRGGTVLLVLANSIRALPTLGLLTLLVILMGVGLLPPLIALVILAVPPILVNSFEGMQGVDRAVADAARGVGLTSRQVLWAVKLPSAIPYVMLGFRLAAVQVVSTATIAAFVGLGGLGRYIFDGLAKRQLDVVIGGSVLVALLAIVSEGLLILLTAAVVSPGVSRRPARGPFHNILIFLKGSPV